MDVRATTIDVVGLRTRILTEGGDGRGITGSRGTPIVLIHGVGGWAENWRELMRPIADSGRRAIAVDLVGNSMGGAVAFITAVTAPDRVRSLALAASGGLGTDVALFLRVATLPGMITLARLFGNPRQGREVLRSCFFDPARIPSTLYEESERYGFTSYPEFVRALRHGVSIRGVKRGLRAHWVAQAPRYRGPVLAIWGREDAVLPISHLADAKAVFPQAEVRIIERCGHLPMVERTDEFLASFLPFIRGAEAAAAA